MKRRWDDDVVFKNQARGTENKGKKEFVNVCSPDSAKLPEYQRLSDNRTCYDLISTSGLW
jgi:hypothetical protein